MNSKYSVTLLFFDYKNYVIRYSNTTCSDCYPVEIILQGFGKNLQEKLVKENFLQVFIAKFTLQEMYKIFYFICTQLYSGNLILCYIHDKIHRRHMDPKMCANFNGTNFMYTKCIASGLTLNFYVRS